LFQYHNSVSIFATPYLSAADFVGMSEAMSITAPLTRRSDITLRSQKTDISYVRVSRWQELILLSVVFISTYLIGGEYSRAVCNVFTTAPAAVYTCMQLTSEKDHTSCYKATLAYWAVHSALFIFDNFLVDVFGYYLGKFLLLTTVLSCVIRRNMTRNRRFQQICSSLCVNSRNEILTHAENRNQILEPSNEEINSSASSRSSLKSFLEAASDETSPLSAYRVTATTFKELSDGSHSQSHPHLCIHSTVSEKRSVYAYEALRDASEEDCWIPAYCPNIRRTISEDTVAVYEGDVTSLPSKELIFYYPYNDITAVTICNRCERPMMWALKSSAPTRLMAHPICGVLKAHSTVDIKLGVIEPNAINAEVLDDVLAFDYNFINDSNAVFDRSFLEKSDPYRRRKKWHISYINRF
uniref:Major sperm protein n=1 Tax=Parascaris univalens TaxID=6257 RepID=A0A915AB04_PARUN